MADTNQDWESKYLPSTQTPEFAGVGGARSFATPAVAPNEVNWEDKYTTPKQEKPTHFVPSIAGESKQPGDWRDWAGTAFGGSVTRGIPGIRHLVPTSQADIKYMEQHPNLETMGNVTGGAVSALPTAAIMPGGPGALGLLANMTTQGAIGGATGVADKLLETKGQPQSGELSTAAILNALGGAAGPLAGKVISPLQKFPGPQPGAKVGPPLSMSMEGGRVPWGENPSTIDNLVSKHMMEGSKTDSEFIDNLLKANTQMNEGMGRATSSNQRSNQRIQRVSDWIDRQADKAERDPFLKYGIPAFGAALEGLHSGNVPAAMAMGAAFHFAPHLAKKYIQNQAMGPTTQTILNALSRGTASTVAP